MLQEETECMLITFKIDINKKKRLTLKTPTHISYKPIHLCSHTCKRDHAIFIICKSNNILKKDPNWKGTSKDT